MASSAMQRVSSLYTGIMKILPVPLVAMATVFALLGIADHTLPAFPDGILVLTMTLGFLGCFLWGAYRLKFVAVDDNYLYVSGWLKHIAIPLSNIESIDYFLGIKFMARLIVVRLKSASEFGQTIYFMPTVGAAIRATLNAPSVVEELRQLVDKASNPAAAI
jgi:hypothetical protein